MAMASEQPERSAHPLVAPIKRSKLPGIVYISGIPRHMNATVLRSLLEPYGAVGRVFLQPLRKNGQVRRQTSKGKRAVLRFSEGWIEFERRKVAKQVVERLNKQPVSIKKKSVFCDILWCLKYLPGLKWVQLGETLESERAVARSRLQNEGSQSRKIAGCFQGNVDRSDMRRKRRHRSPST